MAKKDELSKLDQNIKDTEARLKNFTLNVDVVQKEITFLYSVELQLEENISYLKNVKVIALAIEYKKAKENLKKTKTRLLQLKSDKTIIEKSFKELEIVLKKSKENYDKLTKQNENNVLQGKFGRDRG